jgi:hypothetical protein
LRECAALLDLDLVPVIVIQDDLPFEPTRQLEAVQEHITSVVAARTRIVIARSIATIVITIARVVFRLTVGCRTASQLDPMDLDVARFVIAIPRAIRIADRNHQTSLPPPDGPCARAARTRTPSMVGQAIMRGAWNRDNRRSDGVGSSWVAGVLFADRFSKSTSRKRAPRDMENRVVPRRAGTAIT